MLGGLFCNSIWQSKIVGDCNEESDLSGKLLRSCRYSVTLGIGSAWDIVEVCGIRLNLHKRI